jgi:hypothetical protein
VPTSQVHDWLFLTDTARLDRGEGKALGTPRFLEDMMHFCQENQLHFAEPSNPWRGLTSSHFMGTYLFLFIYLLISAVLRMEPKASYITKQRLYH